MATTGFTLSPTYQKAIEELQKQTKEGIRNKKGQLLRRKLPQNYLNIKSMFGGQRGSPIQAAPRGAVGTPVTPATTRFSEVPEGYRFLGASPKGFWQAPTDLTRFANIPQFLGGGTYHQDPLQKTALIKAPGLGGVESEIPAAMARRSRILNGLSSRLFEVDHIIPIWAGGADVESNWQILTNREHDKKTKVDAVARALYFNKEISLKEALAMGINWRDKETSIVPDYVLSEEGPHEPPLDLARAITKEWSQAPKVTFKDFIKSIPEAGKKLAEAVVPEPLREFFKGFVGGLSGGWVQPKPGDFSDEPKYYEVANKIARITGSIGGTVASFAGLYGIVGRAAGLLRIAKAWNASSALGKFLPFQKVPILKSTLGKIDYGTLLETMGLFGLHGQLSKQEVNDFEHRAKGFLSDLATGTFFAGAGGIANIWAKEATISSGMFTIAKLHGANNEDALIDAVAMGIFGGLKATTETSQVKRLNALNTRAQQISIDWRTERLNRPPEVSDPRRIYDDGRDILFDLTKKLSNNEISTDEYLRERDMVVLTSNQFYNRLLPDDQRILKEFRDLSSVAVRLKETPASEQTGRSYELQSYIESIQKNPPGTVFSETIPNLDQRVASMPAGRLFNTGIVIRKKIVDKLVKQVRSGKIEIASRGIFLRNEQVSRERLTIANQEDIEAGRTPRYNPDDVIIEFRIKIRDKKTGKVDIEQIGVLPILEHLGVYDPTIKGSIKYPEGTINYNAVRDGFPPFPETLASENFGKLMRENKLNFVEADITNVGSQEAPARFGIFREQGHRSNEPFTVMEIKPEHWREAFIRNSVITDSNVALTQRDQRTRELATKTTENIKAATRTPEEKISSVFNKEELRGLRKQGFDNSTIEKLADAELAKREKGGVTKLAETIVTASKQRLEPAKPVSIRAKESATEEKLSERESEINKDKLKQIVISDIKNDSVNSQYVYHTGSEITGIIKNGLTAGGVAGRPELDLGYGDVVFVFKRSDFPRGFDGSDVSLLKNYKPVKPISAFTMNELGIEDRYRPVGARGQEEGMFEEPYVKPTEREIILSKKIEEESRKKISEAFTKNEASKIEPTKPETAPAVTEKIPTVPTEAEKTQALETARKIRETELAKRARGIVSETKEETVSTRTGVELKKETLPNKFYWLEQNVKKEGAKWNPVANAGHKVEHLFTPQKTYAGKIRIDGKEYTYPEAQKIFLNPILAGQKPKLPLPTKYTNITKTVLATKPVSEVAAKVKLAAAKIPIKLKAVETEPKPSPRWTYEIPKEVREDKRYDWSTFNEGLNDGAAKNFGRRQIELEAQGKREEAEAINKVKEEFSIENMYRLTRKFIKEYPTKAEAFNQYAKELSKKQTDVGAQDPFTDKVVRQVLKRNFFWMNQAVPRHTIIVEVDRKTKRVITKLSKEEAESKNLGYDLSLNEKFVEPESPIKIKGLTQQAKSRMDFNLESKNQEVGSRVGKVYLDDKKTKVPYYLAADPRSKQLFIENAIRKAGHVPIANSGNERHTLLSLSYDQKWVDQFDKNPSNYTDTPEIFKTGDKARDNDAKFTKVFVVDVLKLNKDATQHDVGKRLKIYDSPFSFNAVEGKSYQFNVINDPKFSEIPSALKMFKETKFANSLTPEAVAGIENRGIADGVILMSSRAINEIREDNGLIGPGNRVKPSLFYTADIGGKKITIALKGDVMPWDSYREYFESILGKKLTDYDVIPTSDSIKYGFNDLPKIINPNWTKELGEWAKGHREFTIPSEALQIQLLEIPESNASLSITNIAKIPGTWGLNETIKKSFESEINKWKLLVKEIEAAKQDGEGSPEKINEILSRPEYAEYNIDLEKNLYDQYKFAYQQGAGVRVLGKQFDDMLDKVWQEYVFNGGFFDGAHLALKPDFGYIKDNERISLEDKETMISKQEALEKNIQDGEEVLLIRYPSAKLSSLVIAKAKISENNGITGLGKEHVITNPKQTFISQDGDYDGDVDHIFKIGGPNGIPKELTDRIKAENEATGEILVDISSTKIPAKPVTPESLREVRLSTAVGEQGIGIFRSTARVMPTLEDNGIKIIISPDYKYRVEFGPSVPKIDPGEIVIKPRYDMKMKILDAIGSQEGVDSITNDGLIKRGFDENYLPARWFTPMSREAAKDIIAIDKNGYEYIKDNKINGIIRDVISDYQKIFTAANKERSLDSNESLSEIIKEFNDLSRKVKEQGGTLNPVQELALMNEFDPFIRASKNTPEMKSLSWSAAEAARQSVKSIWGETIGKMEYTPKVKEFIDQAIRANKVRNLSQWSNEQQKMVPAFGKTKAEQRDLGGKEYDKLVNLYKRNENIYTQEEKDMIQYWLATDYLANKAQAPGTALTGERGTIKKQSGLVYPIIELMEGPIAQEWHKTYEGFSLPQKSVPLPQGEPVNVRGITPQTTISTAPRETVDVSQNQGKLLDEYPIGKKITFINKDNEIDDGRINSYLLDKYNKVIGFEINDQEVLMRDLYLNETPQQKFPNKEREYTPENITSIKPNEVFVFGSNTEGRHGAGAAKLAVDKFGAKYGQAEGLQGQSYAIVTKDLSKGERSLSLGEYYALDYISKQIGDLVVFAYKHPELKFYVTKLGTKLGGWTEEEIGELWNWQGIVPDNIILPKEFEKYLDKGNRKNEATKSIESKNSILMK